MEFTHKLDTLLCCGFCCSSGSLPYSSIFNLLYYLLLVSHISILFFMRLSCVGSTQGIMSAENTINDVLAQENALSPGDRMNAVGTNMESLTRVELDLAFASEKLLNLEMLVMEIARRATDFEPLTLESGSVSSETAEDAFELDTLYGILDAEVQELDDMIRSLQIDAKNLEDKVYDEESGGKVKAKLDAAMASLKQMQDLIADIRKESAKFEKPIEFSSDQAGKCSLIPIMH